MKKLQTILILLTISNFVHGQKLWNEMHELYPKEVALKNNLEKVIFYFEDEESQSFFFDKKGFLVKEVESRNWHSNDTSEIFYNYEEELLLEVVHINKSNSDTLSSDKYNYENGRLKTIEGRVLSNKELTSFCYDKSGKLESSNSIMTSFYSKDTMQIEHKEYDSKERLVHLKRIVGAREDIYIWDYQKDNIILKRKSEIYEKEEIEQEIEFNDDLQITRIKKKITLPNQTQEESITEMKYDKNNLFLKMEIDGKTIIDVEYIKNEY